MQRYRVKGGSSLKTLVEVLQISSEGYQVRMIREGKWEQSESIELISRDLFETCLRTEYFIPEEEDQLERASGIA